MLLKVIIVIIIIAIYRSQFIYILSTIIVKHQYLKTIRKSYDRSHTYIYNSKYFIQSENLFSHIFINRILFDF